MRTDNHVVLTQKYLKVVWPFFILMRKQTMYEDTQAKMDGQAMETIIRSLYYKLMEIINWNKGKIAAMAVTCSMQEV